MKSLKNWEIKTLTKRRKNPIFVCQHFARSRQRKKRNPRRQRAVIVLCQRPVRPQIKASMDGGQQDQRLCAQVLTHRTGSGSWHTRMEQHRVGEVKQSEGWWQIHTDRETHSVSDVGLTGKLNLPSECSSFYKYLRLFNTLAPQFRLTYCMVRHVCLVFSCAIFHCFVSSYVYYFITHFITTVTGSHKTNYVTLKMQY